ncbi:hypothetical protein GCK32_022420 [Trichostrongylus colubriformis]|uniref:ShKT domain-containing protein n=1 Tax=Trichostrongylus colubriformis TaxID=6319 RepID=A0AAN8G2S6_TRICO
MLFYVLIALMILNSFTQGAQQNKQECKDLLLKSACEKYASSCSKNDNAGLRANMYCKETCGVCKNSNSEN